MDLSCLDPFVNMLFLLPCSMKAVNNLSTCRRLDFLCSFLVGATLRCCKLSTYSACCKLRIVHRSVDRSVGADSPSFGWCDRSVDATLCCCRLSAYSASCKLRIVQRFAAIDYQLLQPGRLVMNSKKDKYFFRRPFQDQALAVYCNAYVSLQFMVDFETKTAHSRLIYNIFDLVSGVSVNGVYLSIYLYCHIES